MMDENTLKQLRKLGIKIDLRSDKADDYIMKCFEIIPKGISLHLDTQIVYGDKAKGTLVFIPDNIKDLEFLLKK